MSLRNNLAASSALVLVSLCGASSLVSAADTKPIVRRPARRRLSSNPAARGPSRQIDFAPKRRARDGPHCSTSAHKPMVLASYLDARGGQALVRGRTERALKQIYAEEAGGQSAFELNNQCVAHTVLRQWSQAGDACDAAVAGALHERASGKRPWRTRNAATRE